MSLKFFFFRIQSRTKKGKQAKMLNYFSIENLQYLNIVAILNLCFIFEGFKKAFKEYPFTMELVKKTLKLS